MAKSKCSNNRKVEIPFHPYPCATNEATDLNSNGYSKPELAVASGGNFEKVEILDSINESQPLISNGSTKSYFWWVLVQTVRVSFGSSQMGWGTSLAWCLAGIIEEQVRGL